MENVSDPSFIERHMSSSAVCVRNLYSLLAETFTVKLKSFIFCTGHINTNHHCPLWASVQRWRYDVADLTFNAVVTVEVAATET